MTKDELAHAIDHALCDLETALDFLTEDPVFCGSQIKDAEKQLILIRDVLIDKVIDYKSGELND